MALKSCSDKAARGNTAGTQRRGDEDATTGCIYENEGVSIRSFSKQLNKGNYN
jgi:hypothetical protein